MCVLERPDVIFVMHYTVPFLCLVGMALYTTVAFFGRYGSIHYSRFLCLVGIALYTTVTFLCLVGMAHQAHRVQGALMAGTVVMKAWQ